MADEEGEEEEPLVDAATTDELTEDEEGWMVLHRRCDGTIDFKKKMAEYKKGFGFLSQEFWIGLDTMNKLTKDEADKWTLRFDLESFQGETAYAEYKDFRVGAGPGYILMFDKESYSGTAEDSLSWNHGMKFSTGDKHQDNWEEGNCSDHHQGGGWWFQGLGPCTEALTTGMPYGGNYSILWGDWKRYVGLKAVTMKMKKQEEEEAAEE